MKVIVQSLPRQLGELKPNGSSGLPLPDSRPLDGIAVIYAQGDEIAVGSLLLIARLNIARSRVRFSSCSFARIAQMSPGRNGGFGSGILPLFQAGRRGLGLDGGLLSFMVGLLFKRPSSLRSGECNPLIYCQLPSGFVPAWLLTAVVHVRAWHRPPVRRCHGGASGISGSLEARGGSLGSARDGRVLRHAPLKTSLPMSMRTSRRRQQRMRPSE